MKHLYIALTGSAFLLLGSVVLGAQEAKDVAKPASLWSPSVGPPAGKVPVPASFNTGVSTSSADTEAIVQYGLSLPDPPPVWIPEDFQQTPDRPGWTERARQALAAEIAKPTPRLRSGRPDMNGAWRGCGRGGCGGGPTPVAAGGGVGAGGVAAPPPGAVRAVPLPPDQRPEPTADQKAAAIWLATFLRPRNQPVYKDSQNQTRQRELWYRNVYTDPAYKCTLVGVPRIAAPAYVVQTDKEITFVYGGKADANTWRVIPIGGEFKADVPATPYGQSIGHWEGDSLVVEVRNLDPTTWFYDYGMFHGPNVKVTERYRRVGNVLVYQAIVEDPDLLAQPYVSTARYNSYSTTLPIETERCVRPATDDIRIDLYPVGFLPEGN